MKQEITEEQFMGLSLEQLFKLMEILGYQQEGDSEEYFNENKVIYENSKSAFVKKYSYIIEEMNIGKMFEIICKDWIFEIAPSSIYNFEFKLFTDDGEDYICEGVYFADELCDTLFQAIVAKFLT